MSPETVSRLVVTRFAPDLEPQNALAAVRDLCFSAPDFAGTATARFAPASSPSPPN
jgi:hypothetical protein